MISTGVNGRTIYALKRVEQALRTAVDHALTEAGITAAHYGVLAALAAAPAVTSAELARLCLISTQSMHELVVALADRGLVIRTPRDRRSVQLCLSQEGAAVLARATPLVDAVEARAFPGGETDRQDLADTLARVLRNIGPVV